MPAPPLARLGMSTSRFLRDHWQKRPLLVRGALPSFSDPLSAEELAGLACEDGVESRIVTRTRARYDVRYGPHAERTFRSMPETRWTLLVQEVNRHVPEAADLLDAFSFIPNVRVDDVMVSYAAPGGGVGPHIDSYDVFLVQGRGRRRWRYGATVAEDVTLVEGAPLRILRRFSPDHDEILEAGDVLYLPPGVAHEGTADTECLTYSVGFRAPNLAEMYMDLSDALCDLPAGAELYRDPELAPQQNPGLVSPAARARVRAMIRGLALSDAELDRWYARFATRLKPGHEIPRPSRAPTWQNIARRLARGDAVARSEEGRFAYLDKPRLFLYVGGEELSCDRATLPLIELVCRARRPPAAELLHASRGAASRDLLTRLFALGALSFARGAILHSDGGSATFASMAVSHCCVRGGGPRGVQPRGFGGARAAADRRRCRRAAGGLPPAELRRHVRRRPERRGHARRRRRSAGGPVSPALRRRRRRHMRRGHVLHRLRQPRQHVQQRRRVPGRRAVRHRLRRG
jgi:50S ribosomal protein L16 3-hydroxylase